MLLLGGLGLAGLLDVWVGLLKRHHMFFAEKVLVGYHFLNLFESYRQGITSL